LPPSTDPRRALEALASEHGVPILRFLRGRGWTLASQVAEGLGIHTTTASKHLAAFCEAGFLERRVHASKRTTHAYRLLSSVIRLEIDLMDDEAEGADAAAGAEAFVDALLAATQRVGGARLAANVVVALFAAREWRPVLRERFASAKDPRAILDRLLRDAERTCTHHVGTATAGRLMRLAIDAAAEGRQDLFAPLHAPEVTS